MQTKKNFAQLLNDARLMADACKAHCDEVKAVGVSESFVAKVEAHISSLSAQDTVQEKLKADLKTATAKLSAELTELDKELNEMRRRVKIGIAPEQWREFGITASR